MSKKPVIGITLDYLENGEYSNYPHYILRTNYLDSIIKHGGIPLLLHYDLNNFDSIISMLNGLLIPGGNFDINPSFYGEEISSEKVSLNETRTKFESKTFEFAFKNKLPILGICGGEQLMNVMLGGTLIQHIPDEIHNPINHEQKEPKHIPTHIVKIEPDSLLYKITNQKEFMVNTTHHQAVKKLGNGVKATAFAPDNVIEAIEVDNHPFCLGVQWHPEYLSTEADNKIFEYFVNTCKKKQ
ncbi:MAG: gamma-glutamyl-gamma-aminobutyrate hydrolase family protein [Sphingobacteriia bacterium]|nr:gamma-glutamyl-gamma-aminobutyrate hydrolase family protein [Sphingobacteriia bacterium]